MSLLLISLIFLNCEEGKDDTVIPEITILIVVVVVVVTIRCQCEARFPPLGKIPNALLLML